MAAALIAAGVAAAQGRINTEPFAKRRCRFARR